MLSVILRILVLTSSHYPFVAFLRVSLPNPKVARYMPSHLARCASRVGWYVFIPVLRVFGLHLNCVSVQIAFSSRRAARACMKFWWYCRLSVDRAFVYAVNQNTKNGPWKIRASRDSPILRRAPLSATVPIKMATILPNDGGRAG